MRFFNNLQNALMGIKMSQVEDAIKTFRGAKRIIFIGNGGSAAICSHMAIDFTKNGGKTAIAFNDSSALTCAANDFGHENAFAELIKFYSQPCDVLVAISSSGRSKNILNAVFKANELGLPVITLSGFDADNDLRHLGYLNFWIDSHDYGIVEITSEAILHSMIGEL